MKNKENKMISEELQAVYSNTTFKTERDEHAFNSLMNTYSGNNFGGQTDIELSGLKNREALGDRYVSGVINRVKDVTPEGKENLAKLRDAYNQHMEGYKARREEVKKERTGKTLEGKMEKWEEKYSKEINSDSRLENLEMAYLGRESNGTKLPKRERTVEKRLGKANDILFYEMVRLPERKKEAVNELSRIFFDYDKKDERIRGVNEKDKRDYLRRQNELFSYAEHGKKKVEAKDTSFPSNGSSRVTGSISGGPIGENLEKDPLVKSKLPGFMQYASKQIHTWKGQAVAGLGTTLLTLGLYGLLPGCNKPTKYGPIPITRTLKETPKSEAEKMLNTQEGTLEQTASVRERLTPDPFKPVPEIQEALAKKDDVKKAAVQTQKQKKAEAKGTKACLKWDNSERLDKSIVDYKLPGQGKLYVRVSDKLAERIGKDISLRVIQGNSVYEANKVSKNIVELSGIDYNQGMSIGAVKIGDGCKTYVASIKPCNEQLDAAKGVKSEEKIKETKLKAPKVIKAERREATAFRAKAEKRAVGITHEVKEQVKESLEAKIDKAKILQEIREDVRCIADNYTEMSFQYQKARKLFGKQYDYAREIQKEEKQGLYNGLKEIFEKSNPGYMSILTTNGNDQENRIPKIVVEFSNRANEIMKESPNRTDFDVTNTTKRPSLVNIFNNDASGYGKDEVFSYPNAIKLEGTPDDKTTKALSEILKKMGDMKTHFNNYWNKNDGTCPVQTHVLTTDGKAGNPSAVLITPNGTEVKPVFENRHPSVEDRLSNDDIKIGETQKEREGLVGDTGSAATGGKAGGSIGGGPM